MDEVRESELRGLGNAFTTDEAIDTTLLVPPLLTAWTRVATAGRPLPFASSAAATVASVGAAIGVFASLAVDERAHEVVAGARACAGLVPERRPATTGRSRRGALES